MSKPLALIALSAITFMPSALSLAADSSTDSRAKPSSFVPHAHTNSHVYGTPIHPAVVGHARAKHHKQTSKKRSSGGSKRDSS
jgi:hypothetical protein